MSETSSNTGVSSEGTRGPAAESTPQTTENGPGEEDKGDKPAKPLWEKFMKGIKSRKTNQNVVWDSMIKKLNRIKAYQKSTQQVTEISDMFNAGQNSETADEEPSAGL